MTHDPLQLVKVRRKEIEAEIARYLARIEELKKELPELATAERVHARLAGHGGNKVGAHDKPAPKAPPSGKPDGTPTVPEMITTILKEERSDGKRGLSPKDFASKIADRWWPNVPGNAVSPIVWRMWKRHQLIKRGDFYMLPSNVESEGPAPKEETGPS